MNVRVDAREIRGMLQQRVRDLMARFYPRTAWATPIMTPLNPTRDDRSPGSFVVWTTGGAAGGFTEYSPKGPPATGDVIDHIAYWHRRGKDRRFALAWARDFLGIEQMDARELGRARLQAKVHGEQVKAAESEAIAARRAAANALWQRTVPIAGTVAESYYAARKIPFALIPNPESDQRFIAALEWWKGAKWDGKRKVEDGPKFPAIVSALRNLAGDVTAVHCVFLRHDGSAKADVAAPKLIRGAAKGSAIRLTRGSSNLPAEEAVANGLLDDVVFAEGWENGLSVAFGVPDARVWAVGGFEFFQFAPVTHACIGRLVCALDNDEGAVAAEKVEDMLDQVEDLRGARPGVMRAHGAKDFNAMM